MIDKSEQVILHHFNDHSKCDEWCKYRQPCKSPQEEEQRQERFRKKDNELWQHVKPIFDELTTPEKMKQCFHKFSCQKNESLNDTMALIAPKNKTFSLTSSLRDRTHFVVTLDSEM